MSDTDARDSALILIGRRQTATRAVIATLLGMTGVSTTMFLFSSVGPRGPLAMGLSIGSAVVLLALCVLWASRWPLRGSANAFGVTGALATAVACLSQSSPLIGLGGCLLLALINGFTALTYPTRSIIAVSGIGAVVAVALGAELAQRTADSALVAGAVSLVLTATVALPVGARVIVESTRAELREADRDSLTGLYNRRAFLREATALIRKAGDPDEHLMVVVIDVDDFKNVNDTAGHDAGDQALIAIAKTLRDQCARTAVIARYGGEEFAVADLLGDPEASDLAQQLCQQIAAIPSPVAFTASVGWSSLGLRSIGLEAEARAVEALLQRADSAMYNAKRGGGNRVGHEPAHALGNADEFPFDVWLHRSAQLAAGELGDLGDSDLHAAERRLDAAIEGVGLQSVFQPIVSLADRAVVGFEVLTRWPQLQDPRPTEVLAVAAATGRVEELERRCLESGLHGGLKVGVGLDCWLFINTEAAATDAVLNSRYQDARLVFELTERSLLDDPGALLKKIDALRVRGYAIALDDVGAQPDSLALLDIVCPEIIKMEPRLIAEAPSREHLRSLAAILAHRERTGATILAEGIETSAQLERARAMGATLGQGYLFGRPARLPDSPGPTTRWAPGAVSHPPRVDSRTPFDIVEAAAPVRTERKDTLIALSRYIEGMAVLAPNPPIVLAAVQDARHYPRSTRLRYQRLAAASPLVVVYGRDLPPGAEHRLRTVLLMADDPLAREWIVLVLGPDSATALCARELDGPTRSRGDSERLFSAAVTHDRLVVTLAARSLLSRMH